MHRSFACIALLVLAGCGPSEEKVPPAAPAASTTSTTATTVAPAAAPPAAPAPEVAAADAKRGEAQYLTLCASCHGPRGAGDGPAGQNLDPRPAHHNDGAYMNALSNEHLFRVIKEGGAAVGKSALMAPWGGALSDAQIRDVIAYVRTLAVPPYEGPQP